MKEAITDVRVLRFPTDLVVRLASTEPRLSWGLAQELTLGLYELYGAAARHVLSTLFERIAHQLLESALATRHSHELVSPLRQQDLADAVGSPRESVARALKRLRDDGTVAVTRAGIRILAAERLAAKIGRAAGRRPSRASYGRLLRPMATTTALADFASSLDAAVARSALARVNERTRRLLLDRGLRLDIPAGSLLYRASEPPVNGILVNGLVRSYAMASDGRQFTLVYSRQGTWLGLPTVAGGPFPLDVETVTDITAVEFPNAVVEQIALSDASLAWSIAEELTRRLHQGFDLLTNYAFASLTDRVSRRLLELAVTRSKTGELYAPMGVAELADSVGATPSSTSRALRGLRTSGAIRVEKGGFRILRADALASPRWSGDEQRAG
jgi:CRP-like cAMP-binding protein